MKKLKLFVFVAAVALMFSACSNDEDFSLEGKWNIVKMTSNFYSGTSATGTPIFSDVQTEDLGWMQFNSDGTGIDSGDYTFTWTFKGDKPTITDEVEGDMTLTLTTKDGSKMVGYYQETYTDENITAKIIIEFAKV